MATKVFFYTLRPYDELGSGWHRSWTLSLALRRSIPRWKTLNWQRAMMPCR